MMVHCSDRSMKLSRRKARMIKRKPPKARGDNRSTVPFRAAINNQPSLFIRQCDEAIELERMLKEWCDGD